MMWMGVSIKHGFFVHEFPNRDSSNNKVSVNGQVFKEAMLKRGGFNSYLRRHPGAVVVMDNCTIYNTTRRFFQDNDVEVLPWPAKSPDLTPIENIWGIIDAHKSSLCPTNRSELRSTIASGIELLKEQKKTFLNTLKTVPTRIKITLQKKRRSLWILNDIFFTISNLQLLFSAPLA